MHNSYMSTGVDSATPSTQEDMPYDNNWVTMNSYPQSTMASFTSTEFAYMPPITTHGLPSHELPQDDLNRMPPPLQPRESPQQKHASELSPKQQQQQQQAPPLSMPPLSMAHHASPHHHHQLPQLPMLTVPSNPTWPSMLTNPSQYAAQPQSIHIAPRSGPQPPAPPPIKTKLNDKEGKSTPRKMLTDDDRRRMCEYAETHPGVKQSEIGAIFGVERSTVSKVLRNKDRYLSNDDRSRSPGAKKSKGSKFPDIERALSNWVRNEQKKGIAVTDAEIKDKLRFFATNTGGLDSISRSSTTSWLEKFKQKNGIGLGRLVRRASETNIPKRKSSINSMSSMSSMTRVMGSPMETAGNDAPLSPATRPQSTSPTSANRSDEDRDALSAGPGSVGQHFMGFGADNNGSSSGSHNNHNSHNSHNSHHGRPMHPSGLGSNMTMGIGMGGMSYKNGNNQSTTSLTSVFTETPVSSFSGSALSPTAPYTFSPCPFLETDPMAPPGSANFQRPRSQTLPALNMDYMSHHAQQSHQQSHQHHDPQHHDPHDHHEYHGHHGHSDAAASAPGDTMTPKYLHHHHIPSTAPSSAVNSPMTDISGPSYGLDSAVVSPQLRRSGSSGSLFQNNPRSAGGLGGATILGSPLAGNNSNSSGSGNTTTNTTNTTNSDSSSNGPSGSPTQDDARRAADTLLTFIKTGPSGFDQTDYIAVARMIDKLRLQQAAIKSHGGMGGLSQIPEGESEMGSEASAVAAAAHHVKMEATLTA